MKLVDREIMRNCSDSKAKLGGVFVTQFFITTFASLFLLCPKGLPFATRPGLRQRREKHVNGSGISLGVTCEAAVALTHNPHSFSLSMLNH